MITRVRLLVLLARPAVIGLLLLFTETGLAQTGRPQNPAGLAKVIAVLAAFLLFSVACNDLADEAIDKVNLPGKRPLAAGLLGRREFAVTGAVAGVVSLGVSVTLGWRGVLVTAAGLAVSAGYSLRPVRLADRGAVASLVLPACYVAVPYLLGVLAGGGRLGDPRAAMLMAGLYLGFIGRILLKDFRDVRGDAMFGKRTFLVRHGRVPTCVFSACCWVSGTGAILAAARHPTAALIAAEAAGAAGALALLAALAADRGARRDEALISATAIVGRGMIMVLLAHLSMTAAHWDALRYTVVIAGFAVVTAGQAAEMLRHGPVSRLTVPDVLSARAIPPVDPEYPVPSAPWPGSSGGSSTSTGSSPSPTPRSSSCATTTRTRTRRAAGPRSR
jgi:4-hydroxybenzoate polyprenyltransferase